MATLTDESVFAPPRRAADFITEAVGDVGRPEAALEPCRDIEHLPGETRWLTGVQNVLGWMRHGITHVLALRERFGPIFRTKFGPTTLVCVSDPDLFLQIARNDDGAWSTALAWLAMLDGLDTSSKTLDMSITLDFAPHREVRKLMQPAFSPAATSGYVDLATPLFERAVDSWVARGGVDFKREARALLADVSTRTFLGVDDPAESARLDRDLADVWRAPFALFKHRWLSPTWRRATNGHESIRRALLPRVAERRDGRGTDLFSRMCRETRDSSWIDDPTLVRVMIGTLIGAFDTTSSGLASMAYLLAKNPEWQERLREEALATGSTSSELKRLEQTECAWKETLRLFPVSSHLPRCSLRDVKLGSWNIPAGTFVWAMIGPLLADSKYWTDPSRFDPERFSADRAEDKRHKGIFLPFGAGAHACLGMHLATLQVKAFWRAMLSRCRFRLEPDYEGKHVYVPLGIVTGDVRLVVEAL
jgi:cytochrome P450